MSSLVSNEIGNTNDRTMVADNELTPEQKDLIHQLRERIKLYLPPERDNDSYLVRWLIARQFDVDKAEDMLRKHYQFVIANGLMDILENYTPIEAIDYFYTAMLGYDKEGSVVRILNVGASDLRGLCLSISRTDCLRHAAYVLESDAMKQIKDRENDKMCEKQIYIMDLKGLSWRAVIQRIVIQRAFTLLKSYEANYPERLKLAYLVNVPSFFSFIYSWLKTVLPESIISKLEVVSPEECQTVLTKYIDPSILPASVGGTRTDPDGNPDCQTLYAKPLGTPVPEHLMLSNHFEELNNDPEAKKVIVEYKSLFIAEKLVTEPNSMLQWDFQTVDYDIRIGLRYRPDENSESVELMPAHRVDSNLIPESGSFICEKPGIYEVVFDNTYSWMTNKELTFKITVALPEKNDDI